MSKFGYAVSALVVLVAAGFYFVSRKGQSSIIPAVLPTPAFTTQSTPSASVSATISPMNQDGALIKEDLKLGTGAEAVAGKKVTVNYKGTLTDGTEFDSSYKRGQPFSFNLGAGEVIQGWDEGVAGMKVGGKRKLTIPPSLGYGANPVGSIPANSTLIFEVELLEVE